jgi:DNA-directed RNA polymerase specialized sigma24 family protein
MTSDDGGGLHDFVAGRYAELRRSAFLMCGDWALADELTQKSLARLVAVSRRTTVDDPDAFTYSYLMAAFQRRRYRRRLVGAPRTTPATRARPISDAAPPASSVAARHRFRGVPASGPPRSHKIVDEETPEVESGFGVGDPIRTILVLDALHKLAPRCRAVLVLRHWDGFAVDETADMLGLAGERVDAYEAAGLAALDYLLAEKDPAR